jgi:signal transduction histidine kinase
LESRDLQLICVRGEPRFDAVHQLAFMPLRMGMRVVGCMGVSGSMLSRQTLEAIGSLVAIAIERAGAVEKLSRAEAARESEQLRSVLLDSVTHEFRSPLTAIKASVTSLLGSSKHSPKSFAGGEAGTADHHQRGKRPPEPADRRSRRDGPVGRQQSGIPLRIRAHRPCRSRKRSTN